ncbi:c-type cytochrome [Tsuneonella sp. HG222]
MSKIHSKGKVVFAAVALVGGLVAGSGVIAAAANAQDAAKVDRAAARELFDSYSCSACHALSDAGAAGVVGPNLDNPELTVAFVKDRVTNGQGAMPGFGGQMSEDEIGLVAAYIVEVNHDAAK